MAARIIFITGTDTGVGKTAFTGLLLTHLRMGGVHALAMKPFCTGGTDDVELLKALQSNELPADEINPFYFPEPIAPMVAARKRRRIIRKSSVLSKIRKLSQRCDVLLIEGAGGLLTPLAPKLCARELIVEINCEVICISANRLGTINHTLLAVEAMQVIGIKDIKVVLMGFGEGDPSCASNAGIIAEMIEPVRVHEIPYLQGLKEKPIKSGDLLRFEGLAKKIKKTLAELSY